MLPKINVENRAECHNGAQQAKQHIDPAIHTECFRNPDGASNKTTDDSKTQYGVHARTAPRRFAPILSLYL